MDTLNEVYSSLSIHRRYEVWFLRIGMADGGGAWWFRYLLMNPDRGRCPGNPCGMRVQAANLGVNPSLTITALAERAISFIPPNLKTTWQ